MNQVSERREFKVKKLDTMAPISLTAPLFLLNQNRMDQETNQRKSGYLISLVWYLISLISLTLSGNISFYTHQELLQKLSLLAMVNRNSKGKQIQGITHP